MNEDDKIKISYYDLDEIDQEFLKYAPAYAQEEAAAALSKLAELQGQGLLKRGVYYIVLVDLVGSTKFAAEHGNDKVESRIKLFITSSFNATRFSDLKNTGIFLKEIGDAVLYIFHHFVDVIRWRAQFQEQLDVYKDMMPPFEIRTCIHVGEVALNGVNPLSLAVSQTFKMEKEVNGGDIVLTEPAYSIAWPTLRRAYHGFRHYGSVALDGYQKPVNLYQLSIHDEDDLERIVQEQDDGEI